MTAPAPLILQGVHKAFDRSQILRGVDLQLHPASAVR
jgi:branched-chain amino acid transport system ATP-binding protein